MNQDKFKEFSEAYREGLEKAVLSHPEDYFTQGATPAQYADIVSKRMMGNIAAGKHYSNNYDSPGFRNACKKVGIKHTRKAIFEYLEIK